MQKVKKAKTPLTFEELQKIYEFASDKMNEYVSAKAFTENL